MNFRETRCIIRVVIIALFGATLINSVAAQEKSASIQSAEALAKQLKPGGLIHSSVRIQLIRPNDLARLLSTNQHGIMSHPPRRIGSALADANLPATSPKRFTLPGISKDGLLGPTRVRPTDWQHLNLPKVNASELRRDKHPNLGLPE